MVDMAHFAGLVAGKVFTGDFIPSRTHISLQRQRTSHYVVRAEAWFFARKSLLKFRSHRGCPMVLGGPLPHVMAAKAVALTEALQPEFRDYASESSTTRRRLPMVLCVAGRRL